MEREDVGKILAERFFLKRKEFRSKARILRRIFLVVTIFVFLADQHSRSFFELRYIQRIYASLEWARSAAVEYKRKKTEKMYLKAGNWFYRRMQKRDLYKSIEYYKKVIQIDPQCAEAYNNLGAVFNKLDQFSKAIKHFNKSLEIDPANYSALNNIGVAYLHLFEYDKAIAYFNKYLDHNPVDAKILQNLGHGYMMKKEYGKAIVYFKRALELKPGKKEIYYRIGVAWYALDENEKALALASKLSSKFPRSRLGRKLEGMVKGK